MKKDNFPTKERRKLYNFLMNLVYSTQFDDKVSYLRAQHEIPQDGIPVKDGDVEAAANQSLFYVPQELGPYWRNNHRDLYKKYIDFCYEMIGFNHLPTIGVLLFYLFHNRMPKSLFFNMELEGYSDFLCALENSKQTTQNHDTPFYVRMQRTYAQKYPAKLHIHESASKNEVMDFIDKNWSMIKNIQDQTDTEEEDAIGRAKSVPESSKKRNALIYKNKDKPQKEIQRILKENGYGFIKTNHIAAILSNEKKKQNQ